MVRILNKIILVLTMLLIWFRMADANPWEVKPWKEGMLIEETEWGQKDDLEYFQKLGDLEMREKLIGQYEKEGGKQIGFIGMLLLEKDPTSRTMAAEILGGGGEDWLARENTPDPIAVPQLIYALEKDPSWEVRTTVAYWIYYKFPKDPRIIPALRKALNDESIYVKHYAATSLLGLKEKDILVIKTWANTYFSLDSKPVGDFRPRGSSALVDIPLARPYLLKAMMYHKDIEMRIIIAMGYYSNKKADKTLREVALVTLLEALKIPPYTPPYNVSEWLAVKIAQTLGENIDDLIGNQFAIDALKEAMKITIRKQRIEELLNKIEGRNENNN
ncbi:MAG: HEAT repeat domain-containing protein [bacterium]